MEPRPFNLNSTNACPGVACPNVDEPNASREPRTKRLTVKCVRLNDLCFRVVFMLILLITIVSIKIILKTYLPLKLNKKYHGDKVKRTLD